MTTTSKRTPHPERVLSKIDARSVRENNQQKCIDCLKPISNIMNLSVKNVVIINFRRPELLKIFIRNIVHFVVYKNGNIVKN